MMRMGEERISKGVFTGNYIPDKRWKRGRPLFQGIKGSITVRSLVQKDKHNKILWELLCGRSRRTPAKKIKINFS